MLFCTQPALNCFIVMHKVFFFSVRPIKYLNSISVDGRLVMDQINREYYYFHSFFVVVGCCVFHSFKFTRRMEWFIMDAMQNVNHHQIQLVITAE